MNIDKIIEKHRLWLETDRKEGSRANLSGANLSGANLIEANLSGANLIEANLRYADLSDANLIEANLRYANLRYANLTNADLYGTIGNLEHIKSFFCETYPVAYTAKIMQIGCQRHKLEEWWVFDDSRIADMDRDIALDWWGKWKPILKQIIAASPATPTGR